MYRIVIVLLAIAVLNVGCVGLSGPSIGNPCKERSFDDWLSFYQLKAKANSSWEGGYAGACNWLDDVARACYPDRFVVDDYEEEDLLVEDTGWDQAASSGFEPSYNAECDLLTFDSYEKIEIK